MPIEPPVFRNSSSMYTALDSVEDGASPSAGRPSNSWWILGRRQKSLERRELHQIGRLLLILTEKSTNS
jgi:hypothetical protein